MKMKLVLFLLCGGFVHFIFASNHLRIFNLTKTSFKWVTASNECKNKNESLVTLYDEEDANFTDSFLKIKEIYNSDVWLGLHRNQSTTWSDNNTVIFRNFTEDVTNGEQRCIAIDNNTWTDFNCSDKKPFMCYEGKNYTLIEDKNMSWCQALQYCRNHFIDLVSISNETENQAVIEKGENKTFWIGLMYDEWKWEDNGCSSFREWYHPYGTTQDSNCTYYLGLSKISKTECHHCKKLFCSKGSVRIKVIKLNRTWEDAFNYCEANHKRLLEIQDRQDQKAVEQWLKTTNASGPFWIALRQSRVFGFWIWSDRAVTVNNWKDGRAPEMPFSQHCGVIETDNYTWHDENCLFQRHFLCEEDIIYM